MLFSITYFYLLSLSNYYYFSVAVIMKVSFCVCVCNMKVYGWSKYTEYYYSGTLRKKCPYSEFFRPVFSFIRTEYGYLLRKSPYSVGTLENTDQEKSEYGHFQHSGSWYNVGFSP